MLSKHYYLIHGRNSVRSSDSTTSSTSIPSLPNSSDPTPSDLSSSAIRTSSQRLSAGAIAGIVVGVVVFVLLAAAALLCLRRRRRTNRGGAGALFGGAKYRGASCRFSPCGRSEWLIWALSRPYPCSCPKLRQPPVQVRRTTRHVLECEPVRAREGGRCGASERQLFISSAARSAS